MDRVLFSNKSDEWTTPDDIFQSLDEEFGFNLDPCSTEENHKCKQYYTKETDGLTKSWGGAGCSAIPRIPRLISGLKRLIERDKRTTQQLSC